MFRKLTIEMDRPICDCVIEPDERFPLDWNPTFDSKGLPILKISCKACKTELVVPHEKYKASWRFEVPYPRKEPKKVELKVLEGGAKVIPLSPLGDPTAVEP